MTILETFIKLRDDLKLWVTNNLNQKANISYVDEKFDSISEFDPTEIQEAIGVNTAAIETKVDKVEGKGLSTEDFTTAEKDKLATVEADANFYEHPTHTSHSSGLYKVTVDGSGHVSGAILAVKEDIVALGIPAKDTTYDTEISDLSDRIDDVEDGINTTNQTLDGVSQEFEDYKTTNNEAVSTNATHIANNKTAIEEIQKDYLTSTNKEQLEDEISKVSEKAAANASAIEILNGEGDGSVKQSIDNAFNEFAANVTNDEVVNTYKELIDYAATHNSEFVTLVGEVDTINIHVGEVETDFSNYKTAVSDQFTEIDTTINNHVTNTNNPHGITKDQIGLTDVDNTSDLNKPISYAMQGALDSKADSAVLNEHITNMENPHEVTKEQIGLENVDNTSDAEKPISNATQEALNGKANLEHAHNDLYYTKDEILDSITVEDIDGICEFTSGDGSDLVSVATEEWVKQNYQLKGDYALRSEIPDMDENFGDVTIDLNGAEEGEAELVNADALGGILANRYVLRDELLYPPTDNEVGYAVLYTAQNLTKEQKEQARQNIGSANADDISVILEDVPVVNILPPDYQMGYWDTESNVLIKTTSHSTTANPIPVNGGEKLYITWSKSVEEITNKLFCVIYFDANGAMVKSQSGYFGLDRDSDIQKYIDIPVECTHMHFWLNGYSDGLRLEHMCLSYSSANSYVPYEAPGKKVIKTSALNESARNILSPLYGKIIVNFGDSIYGGRRPPDDISTELAKLTGATVYNCGFGGTQMSKHWNADYNTFCFCNLVDAIVSGDWSAQDTAAQTIASSSGSLSYFITVKDTLKNLDFSEVDVVTIAFGANDFTDADVLDRDYSLIDKETYAGALRYGIETLLTAFPHLRIYICSPIYRFWSENGEITDDSDTYLNLREHKLTDFVAKTEAVAKEYHLPYIDCYYSLGINKINRLKYFNITDGTHPIPVGCHLIAAHMAKQLI